MPCANINPPATGVILAGGKSSRMGLNKALLHYKNKRLIEHASDLFLLAGLTDVIVSGNIGGYFCIQDITPNQGPLGGVYSVMQHMDDSPKKLIFIPVDMPLLTVNIVSTLLRSVQDFDAAFYSNSPLPLALNFNQNIKAILYKLMKENLQGVSVKVFLSNLRCATPIISEKHAFSLKNINTKTDFSRLPD